ncbi:MAG TPA: hypothetical protein VJL59_15740 [Anaerolineales bacterium]|nr:hypothetical protein [Anaerolineales bacterium]
MTRLRPITLFGFVLVLAACAAPATLTASPVLPTATRPTTGEPTQQLAPTETLAPPSPAASALLPTDAPPAVETVALYNGLSQGYTAEGFPFLGDPAAPGTLIDYSDFL